MSALVDRLRDVIRSGSAGGRRPEATGADGPDDGMSDAGRHDAEGAAATLSDPASDAGAAGGRADERAADVLGGDWRERRGHRYLVVDRAYLPGHRHGRVPLADCVPPVEGWPGLHLLGGVPEAGVPGPSLLFVDLETTGLAGGAGTYAFLVGCAWFDGGRFRVRQFFLSNPAAERAMLEEVTELAGASDVVVTFNGRTFDLPLIETRYLYHRLVTPFAEMPHVDMLHPARRLWRETDETGEPGSCRLSALERTFCGDLREGDVPGFEIPARYFQFVRTGEAGGLEAVLEHNRLDLLSLALLLARAGVLLAEGPAGAQSTREALGLGQLYERAGRREDARAAFRRAAGLDEAGRVPGDTRSRAEALRALALLERRERRYADAAEAWRRLLELPRLPAQLVRDALDALAVHHEHRARDLDAARAFALQALDCHTSASRHRAARHRIARLDRKLGGAPAPPDGNELF